MSAAAARRRKQLLQKQKQQQEQSTNGTDAVATRLKQLLSEELSETTAYEALQLAQSLLRKAVQTDHKDAVLEVTHNLCSKLLTGEKSDNNVYFIGMASQILVEAAAAMLEVRVPANFENIQKFVELDAFFTTALGKLNERDAIQEKQRVKYLQKALKWSDLMGSVRYGDLKMNSLLADALWVVGGEFRGDSVNHAALAEEPSAIVQRLMACGDDEKEEVKQSERDVLLTRAVLVFCAVENLRDANAVLKAYMEADPSRDFDKLATDFLSKEVKVKSHVIFCTSVVGILECEQKAGALYTWLLGKFQGYLQRNPELLPYTTKIGKIYFNIQPPPSMLSQMENMMAMMGGMGAAGMGAM
mmetsp:Transcript_23638/g.36477  ORF Transcript_23638/g.36477 Transcript_23638/m.36477 type:complete len:358 (-) Transcript_23638:42-1115(-)